MPIRNFNSLIITSKMNKMKSKVQQDTQDNTIDN